MSKGVLPLLPPSSPSTSLLQECSSEHSFVQGRSEDRGYSPAGATGLWEAVAEHTSPCPWTAGGDRNRCAQAGEEKQNEREEWWIWLLS